MTIHAFANVVFNSTLDELATILSHELFADVPFVAHPESPRFESPALYLQKPFLGLDVIVMGEDGNFAVELVQSRDEVDTEDLDLDLSEYLIRLLNSVNSVKAAWQ